MISCCIWTNSSACHPTGYGLCSKFSTPSTVELYGLRLHPWDLGILPDLVASADVKLAFFQSSQCTRFFGSRTSSKMGAKIFKWLKERWRNPHGNRNRWSSRVYDKCGKGIGQQCSLGGVGEFVVLYGIVGIIRMERSPHPGRKEKPCDDGDGERREYVISRAYGWGD